MFGLSHCLELARSAGRWIRRTAINGTAINRTGGRPSRCQRDSSRGESLQIEELEGRRMLTLLNQPIFPADNPWNQNISNAPVVTNSAAIISHIGTGIALHPDWGNHNPASGTAALYGIPVNIVNGNTTAKINVIIDNYPGESDIQGVPIPANAIIEGDYQGGPNPNGAGGNAGQRGDSHLIVWDSYNNIAYELFGVSRPGDPKLYPNTSGVEVAHTDNKWHAAQESVWNMSTNTFRTLGDTSADAAGLSILAGLARPDEGKPVSQGGQGAINHALRVTLPSGDINPQYIYPASHVVSVSSSSVKLPFGARLRLANTPAVNTLISNMPPQSQILARAMQQYGLIVADIGSAMYITGSSATMDANNAISQTWNMSDILASNGLTKLHAGDFEVVDLTPVVTMLSSTSAVPGSTLTITGKNFSGAAGKLSVLFGNAAVNTVNLLSDMQVSVVVPNFTGTVHVQVQSGINATDPNNPNNNVKNPIWGYGVSATSTTDQLTAVTVNPGDLNQDGVVGPADLRVQLQALANPAQYLSTYHVTAAELTRIGDVNFDTYFNNRDIQALLAAIATSGGGSGSASSAAQESGGNVIAAPTTATGSGGASSLPNTLSKQLKATAPAIYGPAVALRVESHASAKLIDIAPPQSETKKPSGSLAGATSVWNTYNSLYPIEFPTRRDALLTTAKISPPNQHEALADLTAETFDAIDAKLNE
jgi:hypothetical protein